MESLLNKVLPASQVQELIHGDLGSSSDQATTKTKSKESTSTHSKRQAPPAGGVVVSTDSDFADIDSPKENTLSFVPNLDQGSASARVSGQEQ
jgi:hypothetical protein